MPKASAELLNLVREIVSSNELKDIIGYMLWAGYILRDDFHWEPKPGVSNEKQMTNDEYHVMKYLIDEWDFGGLHVYQR